MIILITGGASGLGETLTRMIAKRLNDRVFFTYAHSDKQARQIETECSNATALKCDFRNREEVDALVANVGQLNIDVLINNAYTGDFTKSYFHKTAADDFIEAFNVNIVPSILITQAAINVFRKKKFGKIITISTAALVNAPPVGSSVYVANKAYIEQLSKVWASENAKFNVTSNIVSPAFMLTGFTNSMDERVVEQIISNHPLKKLLTTEEVAESVCFLINSSQQINGVNLILNAAMNIK
ncbi:MAG: hypothetical protein JWN56_725 [Sphingobacteriales bacterium]|nr:hypothetical protein [Sphingobacteriales bacterium]